MLVILSELAYRRNHGVLTDWQRLYWITFSVLNVDPLRILFTLFRAQTILHRFGSNLHRRTSFVGMIRETLGNSNYTAGSNLTDPKVFRDT